tara:strand:- start:63 stop:359 length:297 start_codon:yes stop_codon:yes gene_type:complete
MTVKVTLAMMACLVKHPKNPNGIELNKLNKMSDEKIMDAYRQKVLSQRIINLNDYDNSPITEAEIIHIQKEKIKDEIDASYERMGCAVDYALRQEGLL